MRRVAIALLLLASLLLMPQAQAGCALPAAPMAKHCCCKHDGKDCCTASANKQIPQSADRVATVAPQPLADPSLFAVAEIKFVAPAASPLTCPARQVELIPSPPPLELNCIFLI